jgi:hypothetical protein
MFCLPDLGWDKRILLGKRTTEESTYFSQEKREQACRLARMTHLTKSRFKFGRTKELERRVKHPR